MGLMNDAIDAYRDRDMQEFNHRVNDLSVMYESGMVRAAPPPAQQ